MNGAGSWLESASSFELAAFFVSWAAVALLAMVVAGLHVRIGRLEALLAEPTRPVAFAGVRGRLIGGVLSEPLPRLVILVSASCASCRRLLGELASEAWPIPTVVAWKGTAGDAPPLPPTIRTSGRGIEIAAALGVQTVPFAVVLDDAGRVVDAIATGSLSTLRTLPYPADRDGAPRSTRLQEVES